MINIFPPNAEQLTRGTAVHLAVRFGMQTAQPFESQSADFTVSELAEMEGQYWLTSLQIAQGDNTFTFDECIISVSQERNIVTTALQGRNGTIKEYISDGDYNITVDAGIVGKYGDVDYPKEQVEALVKLLNLPESLSVHSDFLKIFGIDSAVVKSFSLQQETHSNRQSISIQMLSDKPYEIKLKEDNNVTVS